MSLGTTQSDAAVTASGNSTRATVEALFRHRRLFVTTLLVVLAATALITLFTPRTFQSEMNILVRNARPDYLLSPERSNGQALQRDVTEERINSEIEVLRSRDVADAVVDPHWAAVPLAERTEGAVKAHEKQVIAYNKHLTIEPLRKSNVIHVAYLTDTPQHATETVERLLQVFLAKQREIERSTGASAFFAGEADKYKTQLDDAQQQLANYQQGKGIVTLGTRETALETEINTLDVEARSTQVQVTEAMDRVASDKHQLAMLPERMNTTQRSVYNQQAVEGLTQTLAELDNKRTALATRYQPGDRLLTEVNQQIASTSAALEAARTNNGHEATTDANPLYQQVKGRLAVSTTDLAALRGRLANQTTQREKLKAELAGVEGSTVDFTTLQTRVAELQENYQLYTQKKNEAQIADAMDQQQLVNVAVAERPTFAVKPYRPQILLNAALGLFTGLFLAATVVFFAELGRDTVAAPYELEAISRTPVLATIPLGAEVSLRGASGPGPAGGFPRETEPEGSYPGAGATLNPVQPRAAIVPLDIVPLQAESAEADKESMKTPKPLPIYEPVAPAASTAVTIHPLRLTQPARSYEQLAAARVQARRLELDAVAAFEPEVLEPLAYPAAPPRIEGAARPKVEFVAAPATPDDLRHRSVIRPVPLPPRNVRRFPARETRAQAFVTSTFDPNKRP